MRRWAILLLGAGVLLLSVGLVAVAQGGYEISWWTTDGGGSTFSTGGSYELGGTIGQPDAGVLKGAGYTLLGGFWRGGVVSANYYWVYLPVVLRGY